jgi:ABC-2 type transport system ATP-binding protein
VDLTRGPGAARLDSCLVPPARSSPDDHAVVVDGLVKRYRGVEAVDGLDLHAPRGGVTALLGPNGAGKTTTVECCEGLRRPDEGSVRVLGLDPVRDAPALRPRVGVMLQDGGLPTTVPAGEVLAHVAAMYARPWDVTDLRGRLGIDTYARTQVRRLSGGQRQRLALATAVVGRPDLVFLDEPSAGMDPQARLAVWDLVRELRAGGTTFVVTTHQMSEAEALADHVVIVDHGRSVAAGPTASLLGASAGASLRITVAPVHGTTAPDAELARRLAAAVRALPRAGVPVPTVSATATTGTLEVHCTVDPALVHRVTGWAADEGLLVTSLTTGRRTLEDVFLDLTGRSLR